LSKTVLGATGAGNAFIALRNGATNVASLSIGGADGPRSYDSVFTLTSAVDNFYISYNGSGAYEYKFDNASVVNIVPDRSYKAASASLTGTLAKSQLATGTSLVGYSGFSASNYLREPYSADLDFGTGEFTASAWVNVPVTLTDAMFPQGAELSSFVGPYNMGSGNFEVLFGQTLPAGSFLRISVDLTYGGSNSIKPTLKDATTYGFSSSVAYVASFTIYAFVTSAVDRLQMQNIGTATGTIINSVSIKQVHPAAIFDRAFSSGPRVRLGVNYGGVLTATAFDGTTTRTVTTTTAYNTATWLKARVRYTTDGSLAITVNGREVAVTRGTPLLSLNSRYNQLLYSEDYSNSQWGKSNCVITSTAQAGPYGVNNGTLFTFNADGGTGLFSNSMGLSASTIGRGFFVHMKYGTWRWWEITTVVSGTATRSWVDLQNGVAGTFNHTNFTVTVLPSGWVRIYGEFGTSTVSELYITPRNGSGNAATATGNNAATFSVGGIDIRPSALSALPYQRVGAATDFDFAAPLTIGNSYALDAPFPGSIALLKLGATVPTTEQGLFMYEQEKQLFRAGALSVLPDSGAVLDMAYDDATDRWVAVSGTNESYWTGLVRNSVTPVPAGTYTRIVATSGVELNSRITTNPGVDVSIPAYGLREELVRRAEAASRLGKELATYDYVGGFTGNITTGSTTIASVAGLTYPTSYIGARISGTGIPANTTVVAVSGTTIYISAAATATTSTLSITFLDFILPAGMETKTVMTAGAVKQEGSTKDYTRLYDGFLETIRFGAAPGVTAWVQIAAQRITLQ
jgi:hypothetical protein